MLCQFNYRTRRLVKVMLITLTNTSRIYEGSNSCLLIGSSSALTGGSGLQVSAPGSQHGHRVAWVCMHPVSGMGRSMEDHPLQFSRAMKLTPSTPARRSSSKVRVQFDHKGLWGESSSRERTKDLVNNICHRALWVSTSSASN